MGSDSEDDNMFEQICQLVNTNMDSIILRYPKLWGLTDLPERNDDISFNYLADDFRQQFHISRECFVDLLNKLGSSGEIHDLENKLLFGFWMLTTSESYTSVGDRFNYSTSMAHLVFNEILDAILVHFADYVKWPSANEYPEISKAFKDQTGGFIPGIVGAIDACHFQIEQPKDDSKVYRNENFTYSVILQGVCDHRKIFTDIYVGAPGSLSDSTVFFNSNICNQIDKLIPGEYHLVGDSEYPLMRNLVTHFRETGELNEERSRFNAILSKAQMSVKRAFSILKGRFQKLKCLDTSDPELVDKIVCTCVTLHNHIRTFEVDEDEEEFADDPIAPVVYNAAEEALNDRYQRKNPGYIKRNYLMSLYD